MATGENIRREAGFAHLLEGFGGVAPGNMETRMGGILAFPDVRQGLTVLAEAIARRVRAITDEAAE